MLRFILLFLISYSSLSLEIDEKLTIRVLSLSDSKKTVLINRGLEDGLAVGDHAKFFITIGVIARGQAVKVSPTRSIWSLYRIVDADKIINDMVASIKISTPVKLTDDPSRSLISRPNVPTGTEKIVVPNKSGVALSDEDQSELRGLEEDSNDVGMVGSSAPIMMAGIATDQTLELWGMMHYEGMSTSSDLGSSGTTSGSTSGVGFSLGIEKYFYRTEGFLKDLSFSLLIHTASAQQSSINQVESSYSVTEFGIGAAYHFWAVPLAYNKMIGFINFDMGFGSVSDSAGVTSSTSSTTTNTFEGSSTFFSLGLGLKYYTPKGYGLRALIDYYGRSEAYEVESGESYTRSAAGPRLRLGIAYRW